MKFISTLLILFTFNINAKTINLDEKNTILLIGTISSPMSEYVVRQLDQLNKEKNNNPIYFLIYSNGGTLMDGEKIIAAAKKSRRPVDTITIVAMSEAFNIVQVLRTRYILNYALMMTHPIYIPNFPLVVDLLPDIIEDMGLTMAVYDRVAKRMKLSISQYIKFMRMESIIRGSNNLLINAADEIVSIQCTKDLILAGGCPQ